MKPDTHRFQTTKNICIDRLRTVKEHTVAVDFYLGADNETPYSKTERNEKYHTKI